MTEFYISYNPYLHKFVFEKNGKVVPDTVSLTAKCGERMQALLSPSGNWRGLIPEIAEYCNDDEIRLFFRGKKTVFQDIVDAITQYRGDVKFYPDLEICEDEADVTPMYSERVRGGRERMTEFYISYNPYLQRTVFKKNGKAVSESSSLEARNGERIQAVLSPSENWEGLIPEIAKYCNDDEIRLSFRGRRIDFQDIVYALEQYQGDVKFYPEFENCKDEGGILTELDQIMAELEAKNLPEFGKSDSYQRTVFDNYRRAKNGIFEVSVIATMSSGKSTLINSILHTDLLPSKNEACTATIAEILDNDKMNGYEAECYDAEGNRIFSRSAVNPEKMVQYNSDQRVRRISIEGNIPSVPSDKIRLCLRDTPGPNNSRDENHEKLTQDVIHQGNTVVLYVMNATQLSTNDDKQLLTDIAQEMKRRGKEARDRFLFVINKCDQLDEEKGETVEKVLKNVRSYLQGFGIENPILIPSSARLALLIRKNAQGLELSRSERQDLRAVEDYVEVEELHFERNAVLTPTVSGKLKRELSRCHEVGDRVGEALVHTGVPVVEAVIAEYIEKYAYPFKIHDAVKDIILRLDELNMKARFEAKVAEDQSALEKAKEQIARGKQKYQASRKLYEDSKKKIRELIPPSKRIAEESKLPKGEDTILHVETECEKLTKDYSNVEDCKPEEAERTLRKLQSELLKIQDDCRGRIRKDIEDKVFSYCREMMEDYQELVTKIFKEIHIDDFDFRKLSALPKVYFENAEAVVAENAEERRHGEIRWKKNPEKRGFLGFLKFWEPDEISYTEMVNDGKYVKVNPLITSTMASFIFKIKKGISESYRFGDEQVENYKAAFIGNIDRLNAAIRETLDKMERDTSDADRLRQRVRQERERNEWFSRLDQRIRHILEF